MTAPADWADDVAAQIVTYVWQYPHAREIITEVLRLTYARGEENGIKRASVVVDEYLSRNATGGAR